MIDLKIFFSFKRIRLVQASFVIYQSQRSAISCGENLPFRVLLKSLFEVFCVADIELVVSQTLQNIRCKTFDLKLFNRASADRFFEPVELAVSKRSALRATV